MPNLLIVGVMKTRTTALSLYLEQHLHISMDSTRKPNIFSFEGSVEVMNILGCVLNAVSQEYR
jgi:hypothetical protein